jgi:hypothetical protein
MKKSRSDKDELNRIRRRVNSGNGYSKTVEGVHTWNAAEIFTDFRAVIQIARRALKAAEEKADG